MALSLPKWSNCNLFARYLSSSRLPLSPPGSFAASAKVQLLPDRRSRRWGGVIFTLGQLLFALGGFASKVWSEVKHRQGGESSMECLRALWREKGGGDDMLRVRNGDGILECLWAAIIAALQQQAWNFQHFISTVWSCQSTALYHYGPILNWVGKMWNFDHLLLWENICWGERRQMILCHDSASISCPRDRLRWKHSRAFSVKREQAAKSLPFFLPNTEDLLTGLPWASEKVLTGGAQLGKNTRYPV